jgi:hypothetical protein
MNDISVIDPLSMTSRDFVFRIRDNSMMSEEQRVVQVTDRQPEEEKLFAACPWCDDFDRKDPRNRGTSHGICAACEAKMRAQNSQDVEFEKLVARVMCLLT